jgi:ABC-2 type transport system permease protein
LSIVTDREAGLLKRFRGTPMPRWIYLTALICRTIVVVVCAVFVLVIVGVVFYRVPISADTVIALIVYAVLGTVTMCSLGLVATRVCPTVDTASVVGPFATLILAFISGVFVPVALVPGWLIDIGRVFPLEYLAQGLRAAFTTTSSTGITAENVGVLLGWGLVAMAVAVGTFQWEPLSRS